MLVAAIAICSSPPGRATSRQPASVLATLPPYCADSELSATYERYGPRWQYWAARMSPLFNTIHHYCRGLLDFRAARRSLPGSQAQQILLKRAISEYEFILRHDRRQLQAFPLWPELLIRRGEAAVMLEDWALATASYEQAREVKPDYWPAYLDWAEVLARLKLQGQARDLIRQGLLIDPTVESMRQAFLKYGGALKDIPDKPPAARPAASAQEPAPAASLAASSASSPLSP